MYYRFLTKRNIYNRFIFKIEKRKKYLKFNLLYKEENNELTYYLIINNS